MLRSVGVVVAIALAISSSSRSSEAASLTFASGRFAANIGVFASDGTSPIPGQYPNSPDPALDGLGGGTMSLTPVGASQAGMSLSFSIFSDSHPYLATGSYGASGVPVALEIDELRYDLGPGTLANLGSQFLLQGGTITATLRGSLTVGASTAPFIFSNVGGWGSDGAPSAAIQADVSLNRVILGFASDLSPASIFGSAVKPDVLTVDGVTFGIGANVGFWNVHYVPEPSATSLLAVAGSALLSSRILARRSRGGA
jgi:hypothetical protein